MALLHDRDETELFASARLDERVTGRGGTAMFFTDTVTGLVLAGVIAATLAADRRTAVRRAEATTPSVAPEVGVGVRGQAR
jgi:hypothetical protein